MVNQGENKEYVKWAESKRCTTRTVGGYRPQTGPTHGQDDEGIGEGYSHEISDSPARNQGTPANGRGWTCKGYHSEVVYMSKTRPNW